MNQAETYLKRTADDYLFFADEVWRETGLDKKAAFEEADHVLMRWVSNTSQKTRGVKAPRGIGKTTWGTCAYGMFRIHRACLYEKFRWDGWEDIAEPNYRVKVYSKATRFAREIISTMRGWVEEVWFLEYLRPNPDRDHRDNTEAFDVGPSTRDKNPSVAAFGIESMITGGRAHLVLADDVETPENTKTVRAREELDKQVREFRAIASFGDREIVYFGTPHCRETLYAKLSKRGYEFRTVPLILPQPNRQDRTLDPWVLDKLSSLGRDVGESEIIPLWNRVGRHIVLEKMAEGPVEFSRQFMLVADAEDLEYPLRLSDLIVPDFGIDRDNAPIWVKWGRTTNNGVSTAWNIDTCGMSGDLLFKQIAYADTVAPYQKTVMCVDPSGRGSDQTAWCAMSYIGGYLWVKGIRGDGHQDGRAGDSPEIMRQIAEDARAWGVTDIIVEQQFGGDSFSQLLEIEVNKITIQPGQSKEYPNGWRASVFVKPSTSQKETKIIKALSRPMSAHRIIIGSEWISLEPGLDTTYELQYQLTNITEQSGCLVHDDKIEVLAGCAAEFAEDMRMSPEMMEQKILDEEIDRQLEEAYRSADMTMPQKGWFQEW